MGSLVRVQLSPPNREKLEKSSFSFLLPECQACSFSCSTATVDLRRHSVPTSTHPYCGVALLTVNLCFERFLCSYSMMDYDQVFCKATIKHGGNVHSVIHIKLG